jgi:carbon monoxide dehydrogenase subunit G
MKRFELTLFINRRPQEVFDFITDPNNDLQWQKTLISSEWITPAPAGRGSIKRVVVKMMGLKMKATAEYTEWDPPNWYAFRSTDSPLKLTGTTKFEAEDDGTLLTLNAQIENSGILKLVEGLVIKQAEKQDITNFNALKQILEASRR